MKNFSSIQTLIFDLDGTLYQFPEGSYRASRLRERISLNAKKYLQEKFGFSLEQAQKCFDELSQKYGEELSIGFEKEYHLDRYQYFSIVWNISASEFIQYDPEIKTILQKFKERFQCILLSDAPEVWVSHVLEALEIKEIFSGKIFSGEGDQRKSFGNAFKKILSIYNLKPEECLAIGDQEETDILPAKALGMKTIFIHSTKTSKYADFSVHSLKEALNLFE